MESRTSVIFAFLRMMFSKKVSKAVTPAAVGLIFLDSRFHGNDNNGCFLSFYEFIKGNVLEKSPISISSC